MKIGQSPALVLQKLQFEQSMLPEGVEGYSATYPKLYERIPFLSKPQLKRILMGLEKENLINVTKYKNSKLGSLYRINNERLDSLGFKCVGDGIISRHLEREFTLFILPSLAKKFGIPGAGILQQIHYLINSQNFESMQLTYTEISNWVPFISIRPLREIIYKFEKNNILVHELINQTDRNSGKLYRINYGELSMITDKPTSNLSVDNNVPIINNIIEKSVDKPIPITNNYVDKNVLPDHFSTTCPIISATPARSFQPPHSIDQDLKKIFKENNNKIMGRKPDCGTIPIMKDDVVYLKERLMTHEIQLIEAAELISKFGEPRIKEVLAAALRTEKATNKSVHRKWIIKALELNWNLKENSKGKEMTRHINPEDSKYKRELDENTELALKAIDSLQRSSNDVGEYYLKLLHSKLPKTSSRSNREFAKDMAPNVVDIYSRSESCETGSALPS